MSESFNKNLDKITEYEVVFDFLNRISFGRDIPITSNNNNKIRANTLLSDVINRIYENMPSSFSNQYGDIKRVRVVVNSGNKSVTTTIPGSWEIIRAYSESTGLEVTKTFTKTNGDPTTFVHAVDTPYPTTDIINLYLRQGE